MNEIETILESTKVLQGFVKVREIKLVHCLIDNRINLWVVYVNKDLIWTCDTLEAARKNYEETIEKVEMGYAA